MAGPPANSLEVTGPASSGAELLINFPLERGTPSFCISCLQGEAWAQRLPSLGLGVCVGGGQVGNTSFSQLFLISFMRNQTLSSFCLYLALSQLVRTSDQGAQALLAHH